MRKFDICVIVITAAIQLFLAFTPFIPWTARFWHVSTQEQFNSILAAFVGIELTVLSTTFILLLESHSGRLSTSLERLDAAFPVTAVKRLTDRQFYSDFRHAVENCERSVRICYFAPYPPTDVVFPERRRYYNEILDLMKRRNVITFKRLVRQSAPNERWLADLLEELEGRPNVDIAMLSNDLPADREMPLALSVQIIDDSKVWLVATGTHEMQRQFRDLYIENADTGLVLTDYFDRLWGHSEILLDRGRLNPAGNDLIQRVRERANEG